MKTRLLLLILLVHGALWAAAPSLVRLEPRGGQRGRAVKLTLIGRGLDEAASIESKIPGAVTSLAPPKDSMARGRELPFLVEIDPQTGALIGRFISEERDTGRQLLKAYKAMQRRNRDKKSKTVNA